jgi:protein-L-isoaspartate O-methyltransferase
MKVIHTLDELDVLLAACDEAKSDDALRLIFSEFRMELPVDAPHDPFSTAYHDYQMALYRRIAGRDYALTNEATPFDVEQAVSRPFPYSTASCQTAGAHYVTIGHFLRHLRLPPRSRLVEFGPGWGNLTLALAALGHDVTAVDVEPRFCELIRRRANQMGLTINVVNADFSWAENVTDPYDAIIFFECFHHAADHRSTLRHLHNALKPGGIVYMGAEPILADFPVPWGLRLDGQSLWSIRKFGWMELGFRDDYFHEALASTGWSGVRHPHADPAIWETAMPIFLCADDDKIGTITGQRVGRDIVFSNAAAGPGLFGPYVRLSPGNYTARVHMGPDNADGQGIMQACVHGATRVLAFTPIDTMRLTEDKSYFELSFSLVENYQDLEVRLLNTEGFSGHITGVTIIKND